MIARVERLQQLTATFTFEQKLHNDPRLTTMPVGRGRAVPAPDRGGETRIELLDGRGRWDTRWTPESAARLGIKRDIAVFNRDRVEMFVERSNSRSGMILAGAPVGCSLLEVALGLRHFEFPAPQRAGPTSRPWLSGAQLSEMTASVDKAGNPVLKWDAPNRLTYRWTFRPDLGYAMSRCDISTSKNQLPFAEVQPSDFREVDGFMLPFAVRVRLFRPRDGSVMADMSATVQEISLNDPQNIPDAYAMRWPRGMTVTDSRTGVEIKVEQDDFVISDVLSAQLAAHQPTPETGAPTPVTATVRRARIEPLFAVGVIVAGVAVGGVICLAVAKRRRVRASLLNGSKGSG